MSDIPKNIRKALDKLSDMATTVERNRCLSIIAAVGLRASTSEAHILETIARRVRGEE